MLHGNKDTIMEYFNFLVVVLIILTFIGGAGFFIQLDANSSFTSHAEGVVSRHGGLTPQALEEIKTYSENFYGGRYIVKGCIDGDTLSLDNCQPLGYGDTVEFIVEGNYRAGVFPVKLDLRVNAVSRRR